MHCPAGETKRDSILPSQVEETQWQPILTQSPFTRTLFLSESLILTGVAKVDGKPVATLMDTEAAESIAVSERPTERGWKLVSMSETADIETAVVVIAVESGEAIKVRYDKERMKTASQRMKFAAQARSQQVTSRTQARSGGDRASNVPAERVAMLKQIDQRELPKGYNPGAGRNREESHNIHQSYVDRQMAGMSERQRGLVGQMWQQQQTVQPNMSNRGASFVRVMEHVAENEKR
jgi:hypothetical protein